MNTMNPDVDAVLGKAKKWQDELMKLRQVVLECGLTEELKWYQPCYTYKGTNIVIIGGFKDYFALMFFNGALLSDEKGLLHRPGNHTQAGRQIRMTSLREMMELEPVLKAYIFEAVEAEKAGLKVAFKKTSDYPVPEEFQLKLDESPALKTAFEALTPGRQRAYLLHFAQPKQSATRVARIEKWMPGILAGKGLND